MIKLTKTIKKLFEDYPPSMNKHGQFNCCKCTVFNTTNKDDWLQHVAKYHNKELAILVEERRNAEEVLNEAVESISDNEEDDETANTDQPCFPFGGLAPSTNPDDSVPQRRLQTGLPLFNTNPYNFIVQQEFQRNRTTTSTMSHDLNSQLQFQSNHATTTAITRGIVPEKQLQLDNSSAGLPPQLQVQVPPTEVQIHVIKLTNDYLAGLITIQEYQNAVNQIDG